MKRIVQAVARFLRVWFGPPRCALCGKVMSEGYRGTICMRCLQSWRETQIIGGGGPWTGGR
jgi:hypothetical protein